MALIVTPSQLEQRSELYHQIGAMTSAGLGILPALEMLSRNPPSRSLRKPINKLVEALKQGFTLAESLAKSSGWLPTFDIALLEAGEKSGRLDACFRLLADYYRERSKLVRQVISDMSYPLFVIHAAVLIFPATQLAGAVLGNEGGKWLASKLSVLVPFYAIVFVLIFACQSSHGVFWRALIERFFSFIPVVRSARKCMALARLSAALEALISAGVLVIDAWDLAALSSGSPALHKAIQKSRSAMLAGDSPGEVLHRLPVFPEMFANLYRTGEVSGTLDTTLLRLRKHYSEEGSRKMQALSQWLPKLVYLAIMLAIAQQIVGFYTGYFNQVNEIIK
jgi:type II secretory pathway component PulF